MRLTLPALALLLFGCCNHGCNSVVNYDEQAGQVAATKVVWYETYSMNVKPPLVGWINNDSLNCNVDASGDFDGFKLPAEVGGDCVWGVTWEAAGQVWVSHPVPEFNSFTYHDTFAHELWHYVLYVNTGNGDAAHKDPGFGPRYGHPAGGAVDLADDALLAAGL